jgi:hypothetical protein
MIRWLKDNVGEYPTFTKDNYLWKVIHRDPIINGTEIEFQFLHETDLIAFKLAFYKHKFRTYIDPPGGWKYGFPKMLNEDNLTGSIFNINEWLVKNGYPQHEIDQFHRLVPYIEYGKNNIYDIYYIFFQIFIT